MPHVQKARKRSAREIEEAAEALLQKFAPQVLTQVLPFDVVRFFELDLFEDTGIEGITGGNPPGTEGCTDSLNMKCHICSDLYETNGSISKERRLRSTIAHELGHCYLHVEDAKKEREFQNLFLDDGEHPIEMYDRQDLKAYEDPEWQAWRFASALLMPARCFLLAVDNNRTKVQLKNAFDVNPAFIEVRIKQLGITKQIRQG